MNSEKSSRRDLKQSIELFVENFDLTIIQHGFGIIIGSFKIKNLFHGQNEVLVMFSNREVFGGVAFWLATTKIAIKRLFESRFIKRFGQKIEYAVFKSLNCLDGNSFL